MSKFDALLTKIKENIPAGNQPSTNPANQANKANQPQTTNPANQVNNSNQPQNNQNKPATTQNNQQNQGGVNKDVVNKLIAAKTEIDVLNALKTAGIVK